MLVRAMRMRQGVRSSSFRPLSPILPSMATRPVSTTRRLFEEKAGPSQEQRKPPPEDNAPPQSPFKIFAQVLREEISKNKAWQDNVKQLQGDVDKLADSTALKRAREMYERARVGRCSEPPAEGRSPA